MYQLKQDSMLRPMRMMLDTFYYPVEELSKRRNIPLQTMCKDIETCKRYEDLENKRRANGYKIGSVPQRLTVFVGLAE